MMMMMIIPTNGIINDTLITTDKLPSFSHN